MPFIVSDFGLWLAIPGCGHPVYHRWWRVTVWQ